jgi:hypothetical protein
MRNFPTGEKKGQRKLALFVCLDAAKKHQRALGTEEISLHSRPS